MAASSSRPVITGSVAAVRADQHGEARRGGRAPIAGLALTAFERGDRFRSSFVPGMHDVPVAWRKRPKGYEKEHAALDRVAGLSTGRRAIPKLLTYRLTST